MKTHLFVAISFSILVSYALLTPSVTTASYAIDHINEDPEISALQTDGEDPTTLVSVNGTANWNHFEMDMVDTYAFPVVGKGRNDSTNRVYFSFPLGKRKSELWEYTWNTSNNNFAALNAGNITNLGACGDICIAYGRNDTTLRIYVAKGASGIIEEYSWNRTDNSYTISQLPNLGGHFYMGPWVGKGRNDSTHRVYVGLPNGTAYELTWNSKEWTVLNMGSIENFAIRGVSGGYGRNDSTVRVYFGGSGPSSGIYEFSWNQTNNNYIISKILDKPFRALRPPVIGYGRNDTTFRVYGCDKDTGDIWELTWNGTGWHELYIGSHGTGARRIRIADGRNDGMNRIYVGDRPTIYELTWNALLGNYSFTGNVTTEAGKKWIWIGPGRNDSQNRIYVNNEQTGAYWLREYTHSIDGIHDVALLSVTSAKTVVGTGLQTRINITIENQGDYDETFNVKAYADQNSSTIGDEITIGTQKINLFRKSSDNITFNWSTGGSKGNYTLKAYATPVLGELDIADNNFSNGWIIVSMVGDITGPTGWPDGRCNIRDVALVARKFDATYPDIRYDSNCDINSDLKIDIRDIATVAIHYGEVDP